MLESQQASIPYSSVSLVEKGFLFLFSSVTFSILDSIYITNIIYVN